MATPEFAEMALEIGAVQELYTVTFELYFSPHVFIFCWL